MAERPSPQFSTCKYLVTDYISQQPKLHSDWGHFGFPQPRRIATRGLNRDLRFGAENPRWVKANFTVGGEPWLGVLAETLGNGLSRHE